MRVVVDTNVFVSSFFGGYPRKVIDLWKKGEIALCLTSPIVQEYVEVLSRMGLVGEPELEDLLDLFRKNFNALFTAKTPKIEVVRDPDDNKFIECAVALKADCIVSGDRDLTVLKNYMGISILTPKQFVLKFA